MGTLVRLWSNAGTEITAVDQAAAADAGYAVLGDVDFGNVVWQHAYSAPRGMLGALPAFAYPDNRQVSMPFRVTGDGDGDLMASRVNALARVLEDIRRTGGGLTWRNPKTSAPYRVHFQAFEAQGRSTWDHRADTLARAVWTALLTCAPLVEGDPLTVFDDFDDPAVLTDGTLGVIEGIAGTPTGWSVANGRLVPTTASPQRLAWEESMYGLRDVQITTRFRVASGAWSSQSSIAVACRIVQAGSSSSWLMLHIGGTTPGGMQMTLYSATANGGSTFAIGASTGTVLTPGAEYWLRLRVQGDLAQCELWLAEPTPLTAPSYGFDRDLATLQASRHYSGLVSPVAWVENANGWLQYIESFSVDPFTYFNMFSPDVVVLPADELDTYGPRADIDLTLGGESWAPASMRLGWWRRPRIYNKLYNGGLEELALGTAGWTGVAVGTVVTNGPSTLTRDNTATRLKYGAYSLRVQTPASTDSGANALVSERLQRGRVYLGFAWISAATATTNMRIKLSGENTDIVTGPNVALATTSKLLAALLRPSLQRGFGRLAVTTNAATATDFNIDAAGFCETVVTQLSASITTGATTMPVEGTPTDLPDFPFHAIVGVDTATPEIVRVTGRAGNTWTIERAREGTAAVAWTSSAVVAVMPELETHRRGDGAACPFGILDAGNAAFTTGSAGWTLQADATMRGGLWYLKSPIAASGGGQAGLQWYVDPQLVDADDYTQGREVAFEVYARVGLHSAMDSPHVVMAASAAQGTVAPRYSAEGGAAGLALVKPSSGLQMRNIFCGTMRLPVDLLNPQRWLLTVTITWGAATPAATAIVGLNFLECIPARARLSTPEGKVLDASYPTFMKTTDETTRRIRADLTSGSRRHRSAEAGSTGFAQDVGLGGNTLELPYSRRGWEVLLSTSNLVPGDPTANTSTDGPLDQRYTLTVRPTPRYGLIRDA